MALGWEFILADAMTREHIGKMRNAHDRTLGVDLNKSGTGAAWLKTDDELARSVWPWSTCLMAQYTDDDHAESIFWSGPINSRNTALGAGRTSFTAVGWFERLMHLNLQDLTLPFVNQDAAVIVSVLLEKARELDPRLPITMGRMDLTQTRTITYALDQSIGQAILDLVNLEAGFDWYIDPVTIELNIVARMGVVDMDVQWTFIEDGLSEHSNLSDVVENIDGATVVNDMRARGRFATGFDNDPVSQAQYGVFMEAPSLSDVVDNNILNAFATAEIFYRAQPRVTYTLTPKPSSDLKVPRLFRDFNLGDTNSLTARRDFINVAGQPTRVFGASMAISDVGVETLTNLQTTAS